MTAKYNEITLGESTCAKIKLLYFELEPWSPLVADKVGKVFKELKSKVRELTGMDELKVLEALVNFSLDDIRDVLNPE